MARMVGTPGDDGNTVEVHLTVRDVRYGEWCGRCFLPSAVTYDVLAEGHSIGRGRTCTECGPLAPQED